MLYDDLKKWAGWGVGWERGEMEAPKGEDKCTPTADSHSVQKKLMQLGKAIMLQFKKKNLKGVETLHTLSIW